MEHRSPFAARRHSNHGVDGLREGVAVMECDTTPFAAARADDGSGVDSLVAGVGGQVEVVVG